MRELSELNGLKTLAAPISRHGTQGDQAMSKNSGPADEFDNVAQLRVRG